MKKTDKTTDKRGKKSGEIAEEKLDKVSGGATGYQATLAATATTANLAGSVYQSSTHIPSVPKPPIIKP